MNENAYAALEEKLIQLIRIPTVCRTERYEIKRYREKLVELFPEVFRRADTQPIGEALLLKIAGEKEELLPVLFTGHMDVVNATEEDWTFPPFSGTIENGKIWGRGSLDMKGAQCALLAALDKLLTEGFTPRRTLYLYLSCDEEIGGYTAEEAAQWLKGRGVELETVFDEGGTIGEDFWERIPGKSVLVAVAEKGSLEYRFTAKAEGGHAANPPKHSAIVRLCALVSDLEENSASLFRRGLQPQAKQMLLEMCRSFAPEQGDALRRALTEKEDVAAGLTQSLPDQASFLLGATIAFTKIEAGTAFNVMPKTAALTANVRPSAIQGEQEITAILKRKAEEYQVECELVGGSDASPCSDTASFGYQAVEKTAHKLLGQLPVVPFILVGGTDSKHFLSVAKNAIRFSPIFIGKNQGRGVHGVNEWIETDSLHQAASFYENMIRDFI
ncbi:MAG: M20/M25/M40 family metallo-hydrolase [Eubacteriales bacterium]|nr:M20/M25/M40 family metallo-hydrolase [Eubacteriales bacterium]